jgi:hypothetical protein
LFLESNGNVETNFNTLAIINVFVIINNVSFD